MFDSLFDAFEAAGMELRFVGGCVRDRLLGIQPKDFDFATSARPTETTHILEKAGFKPWPLGEKFGTIAVKVGDEQVEITTYRRDMSGGRHPSVAFSNDIRVDLERRDFTMNSMAMTRTGRIIDLFGGAKDLTDRVIRCTGSPYSRFSEDPLRMLRAARFAARFDFRIAPKTLDAMIANAHSILSVSRERWMDEMTKLLVSADAATGIEYLRQSRLLWLIVPEMWAVHASAQVHRGPEKDLWRHVKLVVSQSPARPVVRWAALLHDIAKPQTYSHEGKQVHFLQHEVLGAEMVEGICRRLKMSNDMRRAIRALVFLHQRVSAVCSRQQDGSFAASDKALRRLIRECDERGCSSDDLFDLFAADCSSANENVRKSIRDQREAIRCSLDRMRKEDLRPRLPKGIGEAIMKRFDLVPGPRVGRLRASLERMLLDGIIHPEMDLETMVGKLEEDEGGVVRDGEHVAVGKLKPLDPNFKPSHIMEEE